MTTVLVDQIPGVVNPVEGTDYQLVQGAIVEGSPIRIRDNGREIFTRQPPAMTAPSATNPSNSWYGKKPKPVDSFWGLVGFCIDPVRVKRMYAAPSFMIIREIINTNDTIDPDDKDGDFLYVVSYLTNGAISSAVGTAPMWAAASAKLAAYKAQGVAFNPSAEADGLPLMTAAEIVKIMNVWT